MRDDEPEVPPEYRKVNERLGELEKQYRESQIDPALQAQSEQLLEVHKSWTDGRPPTDAEIISNISASMSGNLSDAINWSKPQGDAEYGGRLQRPHSKELAWRRVIDSVIGALFLVFGSVPGATLLRWPLYTIAFVAIFLSVLDAVPMVQGQSEPVKRLLVLTATVVSLAVAWPCAMWINNLETVNSNAVSQLQSAVAGRHLATSQKHVLIRNLQALKGHKVSIVADLTNGEANRFAHELWLFLGRDVGIDDGQGIDRGIFNRPIPPLMITLMDKLPLRNTDAGVQDALTLRNGLVSAGLLSRTAKIEVQSQKPPLKSASVEIVVGPAEQ